MANGGPEKEVATALWDIAGHIHNYVNKETVKEGLDTLGQELKEGLDTLGEELKEATKSGSVLGTTESVTKTAMPEVVKAVFNPENMCHVTDGLFNNASTTVQDICTLADAPSSSYLGYALGGLGTALTAGLSILGLRKLYGARTTAETLIKTELYAALKDSVEALELIEAVKNDEAKIALINALTVANIQTLLALEKTAPGTLKGLAKASKAMLAHQIELAIKPVVVEMEESLKEKGVLATPSIVGTSNVASSSTPVEPTVELADTILTSDAGQAILAKIRSGEKAKEALAKMDETALKALAKNAPKLATGMMGMNDATVAATLEKISAMAKPKATVSLSK